VLQPAHTALSSAVCAALAVRDTLPVDYSDGDGDSDGGREKREEKREESRDDRREEKREEIQHPNAPSSRVSLHVTDHRTRDGMTTQLASKISRLVAAFSGVKDAFDQKPSVVSISALSIVLFLTSPYQL
jgi:hypothetical protein